MLPLFCIKQISIIVLLYSMKILKTSTGTQRLTFVPRTTGQGVNIKLTNKNTRVTTTIPSLMVYDDGYSYIDAAFTLEEGAMYDLEIEMITQFHFDSIKDNNADGTYKLFDITDSTNAAYVQSAIDAGFTIFYRVDASHMIMAFLPTVASTTPYWNAYDTSDGSPSVYSSKTTYMDVTNLPSSVTWTDTVSSTTDTVTISLVEKEVIYRDTVFCTDQTDYQKYTVNQGEYVTENTHDNDFIVL